MEKGGVSKNLILIILIVIIAVVLFFIIRGIIKENQSLLGENTPSLEISEVKQVNDSTVSVIVKNNTRYKESDGIVLTAYDKNNSETEKYNLSMSELEKNNFEVDLYLNNISNTEKLTIAPISISKSGKQTVKKVQDEYIFSEDFGKVKIAECVIYSQCNDHNSCTTNTCSNGFCTYPKITSCINSDRCCPSGCTFSRDNDCKSSGGGDGSGSSGGGSNNNTSACTDTCSSLGYVCGIQTICSNSVNCGTCGTGYNCATNGTCIKNPCTDTCTSLGYQCGFHSVCGVLTNCGGCSTGYNCNSNSQCVAGSCTQTCTTLGKTNACGWLTICGNNVYCGACSYGLDCINSVCTATHCTESCASLGYGCGTHTVCGVSTNCGTCVSGESCKNNICVANSCFDGTQNNGETGVDCGGPCIDCVEQADYYVAVNGNDNNPGTITQPFATWQKAFNTARAGDLVYFRGGVYYYNDSRNIQVEYCGVFRGGGTPDAPIRFFAYPGERPILDLKYKPKLTSNYGILIGHYYTNTDCDSSNLYFKGLEVRNVLQHDETEGDVRGIEVWQGDNLTFENMVVHDNGGKSFAFAGAGVGRVTFINCDAYNNIDWYNYGAQIQEVPTLEHSLYIGGGAGGIIPEPGGNGIDVYMYGCRAWNNSDGGMHLCQGSGGSVLVNNTWTFWNGRALGDGDGFKGYPNGISPSPDRIRKTIINSIAAGNRVGFDENSDPERWALYNTFAYHNGYQGWINGLHNHCGYYFCSGADQSVFRNNIAYDNMPCIDSGTSEVCFDNDIQSNNNWNGGVTVSDADFVSLDMTQLMLPRHINGSLPDITFGHLRAGSDLIDAGVNVGLPYSGNAPDIGAFEYS